MANALNWFEIPVTDFERAKTFYERVLNIAIETMVMGPVTMGMLSSDQTAVGGAIVQGDGGSPSKTGTIIYLNCGDDLAPMLERAKQRILLLDSSKFGHSAPYRVTGLSDITQIITDSRLDAGWSKRLNQLGIGIQLVSST